MKLLPIIVFQFSKAGCLELAESLEPQISFTDGFTKGQIMKFIKQKL
jgi:superfamily II RNA helicase